MKSKFSVWSMMVLCIFVGACSSAGSHLKQVRSDEGERLTVGKVQKEIRVGMPSSEVASVLGSPNMVTTDEQRREVWVYDKIATESAYSTSRGGASALVLGIIPVPIIGGGAHVDKNSGARSTSQRTLTVIVKFDNQSRVRDFAYHTSSF